jgi:hypothetical protein
MEYASKYQKNLKGWIYPYDGHIPEYNAYAQEVLAPQMDPTILKELQEMEKTMILIIKIQRTAFQILLYRTHSEKTVGRMAGIH